MVLLCEWKEMANAGVAPAIIDNPHQDPNNYSTKVLHFPLEASSAGANPWAGTRAEINKFTITGSGLIRIKINGVSNLHPLRMKL